MGCSPIFRQGHSVHEDARSVIYSVWKYFENQPILDPVKCTTQACRISKHFLNTVRTEAESSINAESEPPDNQATCSIRHLSDPEITPKFATPEKHKGSTTNRNWKNNIDSFTLGVLRNIVHEFFARNEPPVLRSLLPVIKHRLGDEFPFERETLRKIMHTLRFVYTTDGRNFRILYERPDIIQWRIRYLEQKHQYELEGRSFCFLDETWLFAKISVKKNLG